MSQTPTARGYQRPSRRRAVSVLVGLGAACLSASAGAVNVPLDELAPGGSQIPAAPIELGVSPPPMIMLLIDDSLSMSSNFQTDDLANGADMAVDDLRYRWITPLPVDAPGDNGDYSNAYLHRLAVPTEDFVEAWNDPDNDFLRGSEAMLGSDYDGVWRARNSDYNPLYYDPSQTYDPWPYGVDASGTPFGDASVSAARLDPFDAAAGTVNLTAKRAFTTTVVTGDGALVDAEHRITCTTTGLGCLLPSNFVDLRETVGHYYVWTDSNDNGVVDADDTHTRVNIASQGAAQQQNFANWFVYHRSRALRMKGALSEFMASVGDAYMGVATVNNNPASRIEVAELNQDETVGNRRQVMDTLFSVRGNAAGTPLQNALFDTGEYLECTGGTNLFGNTNCPRLSAADDGQCQRAATIVVTDGFASANGAGVVSTGTPAAHGSAGANRNVDNTPFGGVATNADGDGDTAFDGGAYADAFSSTLGDVAMDFYERDLDGSLNSRQFMETYVLDLGIAGSLTLPSNPTDPVAWPNPDPDGAGFAPVNQFDDLLHAAYNGRGQQCAVDDPNLAEKFSEALLITVGDVQGTTSVGLSSGSILSDQRVFLASFDAEALTGDLVAFDLNLDGSLGDPVWSAAEELDDDIDTNGHASRLVLTFDPTARIGMPFSWEQFSDETYRTQTVTALQLPPDVLTTLEALANLADPVLNLILAAEGTVLETLVEPLRDDILDPIIQQTALNGLGVSALADALTSPLSSSEIDTYSLLGLSRGLSQGRVEYLRGDTSEEVANGGPFRDRTTRMGPIYHSRPVVVGPPDTDYPDNFLDDLLGGDTPESKLYSTFRDNNASRREMVYVGANDGMLHGFDAETGEELLAYIPGRLLGKVANLTDPGYQADTFVDGRISVVDAFDTFPACPSGEACWRTILVGSLRGGGQGIYALDITDPEAFVAANTFNLQRTLAEDIVLWEFTDSPGPALAGMVNGAKFLVQGVLTDGLDDILSDVLDPTFVSGVVDGVVDPICDALLTPLVCALVGDITGLLGALTGALADALAPLDGLEDSVTGLPVLDPVATLVDETLEDLVPTDDATGSPELGYTFGQPNIVRMADGRWAAVIGNGYHSTDVDLRVSDTSSPALANLGFSATGNAFVFVIDLASGIMRPDQVGATYRDEFNTGSGSWISPNTVNNGGDTPISASVPALGDVGAFGELGVPGARPNGMSDVAPVDLDGDGIIDRLYAGDERGALWRMDVDDADSGNWEFAFVTTGTPEPLANASTISTSFQPITTRPEVTFHPTGDGFLVLFGTGKFHEVEDLTATGLYTQSFYAIWDKYDGGTSAPTINRDDLLEQTIDEQVQRETDVDGDGEDETTVFRVTSNNSPNWRTDTNTGAGTHLGWVLDMINDGEIDNQGERMLGDPRLRNGQISFATVIPGESQCAFEGESWFFRLDAGTGGRPLIAPFSQVVDGLAPTAIRNDAISELPQVLLTPSGQEVNLARDEDGDINTVLTEPGGFERQRATWRELR